MGESKCFQWNMNRNNCCAIPSSLMFNTLLFIFSASHHCQTDTSGSLSHTRSLKPQKLLFFLATTLTILNLFLCRIVTGSDEFLRPKMASLIILVWEVYIYQWKLKWKLPCEPFFKKQSSSNSFQLLVPVAFELKYKNSEMYLLPKASPFWLKIHIYIHTYISDILGIFCLLAEKSSPW